MIQKKHISPYIYCQLVKQIESNLDKLPLAKKYLLHSMIADFNSGCLTTESMFNSAILWSVQGVMASLITAGVSVNQGITRDGATPLFCAVSAGNIDVIKQLLAAGADVNLQDKLQENAFMEACHRGRAEVVALMIKHGARPELKNHKGRTGFDILKLAGWTKENNPDLFKVIQEKAFADYAAVCVGMRKDLTLTDLVGMGLDVNGEFSEGTSLNFAIQANKQDYVRELIKMGADVNKPVGFSQVTPFMQACIKGRAQSVEVLMDNGVDYTFKDRRGLTGLDMIQDARWAEENNPGLFAVLRDKGILDEVREGSTYGGCCMS